MGRKPRPKIIWKDSKHIDTRGYIRVVLKRDDFFFPMANPHSGYILEHRLIVAKALGRNLHSWELVHHKNGIKGDNRYPENLQIIVTGSNSMGHSGKVKCPICRNEFRIL